VNIRSKLTLRFSLIVAGIIVSLFLSIYYFSSTYREAEFYGRLKSRGINTAKLFIDVNEVDSTLLRIIDQSTRSSYLDEDVVIYDFQNNVIYSNYEEGAPIDYASSLINNIKQKKEIKFTHEGKEAIGFSYKGKVVIVNGYDKFGLSKLRNLRFILIVGFLFSITLTVLAGWFFATQALKPVARITSEAGQINASNLKVRINEGNQKDELARLAITFNNLLNRIEKSFTIQRSFVSDSSHELRTPLTSIRGQIEVSLLKDRKIKEYKRILFSILEDVTNLISLTNNLLDIATINTDGILHQGVKTRIDEQLFFAREELLTRNPDYKANITFSSIPEAEQNMVIFGNTQLLRCAFLNVMENGCKYSNENSVDVSLYFDKRTIYLRFVDKGIGIPLADLDKVIEPFYRASNAYKGSGHGLGLALANRIIQLHKGKFTITSEVNIGTTVQISLPTI